MSYIPGTGSVEASIASQNGSGITITPQSGTDDLALNLTAGANISLVPSLVNTSLTINASPGGAGVSSVSSYAGAGVTTTTTNNNVTLSSALIAGTGIQLTPALNNPNLTITNTQVQQSSNGSGIAVQTNGATNNFSLNLVAGSGIVLTPSGINSSKTISVGNLTQSFVNLQPGQIPSVSVQGNSVQPTSAPVVIPVLNTYNIPTIPGAVYSLEGTLQVSVVDGNAWNVQVFLNNNNNDLYIFQASASQIYSGIYTNANIPFALNFYGTGNSVQLYLWVSKNASNATAYFPNLTFQRLL